MKKIIIFILAFFILNILYSQNNKILEKSNFRIIYNYKFFKDSSDIGSNKITNMELLIGKHYSLFQSLNTKFNDSLYNVNKTKINEAKNQVDIFSILSERKKDYLKYKILKQKNNITTFTKILMDRYMYNEITKFKWILLKDTLTINNFKCNKAITHFGGRSFIAWYTTEIPISEGPYKFNGLPGLIIKLYDTKKQHIFNLIRLERIMLPIVILNDTQKPIQKITKKQYFESIESFKADPISYFTTRAKIIIKEQERQKKYDLFLKISRRYKANEIELKIE